MTKAYRTVSLNAALVLAGILPLDLRIREAAALYEIKRGVSHPALGDRETENRTPFAEAPHPAQDIDLKFTSLVDREAVDANNTQAVRIFTDGSKIEGKVGAALSIWNSDEETKALKLKLAPHCTVYQAELLAIWRATGEILQRPEQSFGIYSDSRSALESLINPNSHHPLATQARRNIKAIQEQHKTVALCWIKAHAGLDGNERADHLAKEAALKSKKRPDYNKCPVSFAKRTLRQQSLVEWNQRYQSSHTATVTKIFFPDAVAAHRTVRKLKIDNVITQILTGHGGFSEYLNRFKCSDNPACACDRNENETVQHLLFECPIYAQNRISLEYEINEKVTLENAPHLIKSKCSEKFMTFSKNIAQRTIDRNKTSTQNNSQTQRH